MKSNKRGFSLIEVVMALAIISVGVLPILSMYPSALKMTTKATTNEEWSRVTMSILDYVKSRGYDGLTAMSWTTGSTKTIEKSYNFVKSGESYTSESNAFETDFGIGSNLFVINTKGINLENYKFSIYMENLQPKTNLGGSNLYDTYELSNDSIKSSTSSSIIYGIIKIREKNATQAEWDEEKTRDMKFIITPIEKWGD
jgi:prepilin-type N-terminal cleavage/methylation domain-containing protein